MGGKKPWGGKNGGVAGFARLAGGSSICIIKGGKVLEKLQVAL